jgi:hypothetical protein
MIAGEHLVPGSETSCDRRDAPGKYFDMSPRMRMLHSAPLRSRGPLQSEATPASSGSLWQRCISRAGNRPGGRTGQFEGPTPLMPVGGDGVLEMWCAASRQPAHAAANAQCEPAPPPATCINMPVLPCQPLSSFRRALDSSHLVAFVSDRQGQELATGSVIGI